MGLKFTYFKSIPLQKAEQIGGSLWFPGAKVRRGIKHSSDPSQMYNITTIGLPTTTPVHFNCLLGGLGACPHK